MCECVCMSVYVVYACVSVCVHASCSGCECVNVCACEYMCACGCIIFMHV